LTFQQLEGVNSKGVVAMLIRELAQKTGVSPKTIRYYESIGLLPRPKRAANNYRQYAPADVERLRFIVSARSLGFSLQDIAEILAARDKGIAPCQRVLDTIAQRLKEIDHRIADLLTLRNSLEQLYTEGAILPLDDISGEHCICYLLKTYRDTRQVTIQKGEFFND
jgi:DNA-binding transcriptional MerR regulator